MKKNIVALAVASAIAAPVAMADAPTVYGQINMSLEQYTGYKSYDAATNTVDSNDGKKGTQVDSRASRIGVKGATDLGSGLKAVYKVEFEVQIDESSTLKNRNQYVGLAGGFGTVLMGRHDTPTKMSQVKDFFNDGPADLKYSSVTSGSSLKGGELRVSDVLAYVSPSFGGVKLAAAAVPSEGAEEKKDGSTEESNLFDTYSVALMYGSKKKGLYLAAGYDSYGRQDYDIQTGNTLPNGNLDASYLRLSAQYAIAGLTVNGMYAQTDIGDIYNAGSEVDVNLDSTTWMLGAAYKIGNFTPKAKYSVSSYDKKSDAEAALTNGGDITDKTLIAVGVDYALGKKTTAYAEYVNIDGSDWGVKKTEQTSVAVGLKHKF